MSDDKGSDLDVFEGLTKKKREPSSPAPVSTPPPQTLRGGLAPASRPLPPPKSGSSTIPKPKLPPKRSSSGTMPAAISGAPPPSSGSHLPKPTPPPSRNPMGSAPPLSGAAAGPAALVSEAPEVSVSHVTVDDMYDEAPTSAVNVLPGEAMADLDWDDDEEATNVFDRSGADLFAEISAKPKVMSAAPEPKRNVGAAAALLAGSGRSAAPVAQAPSAQPRSAAPMPSMDPMPRIPAPAPVPREIIDSKPSRPAARQEPHPSWHPGQTEPAAKPRSGGGKSTLILAFVALVVVSAAAFFYLRQSADAQVVINVTHQGDPVEKANIYVDGQKRCDFAPCKLELKPGPVAIRVVSGNLAGSESLQLKGGQELSLTVPLGVSDETAPPASASAEAEGPATVKVSSKMEGVPIKVFVGDSKEGKALPAELTDLEAGKVTLRFEAEGDKYGTLEKTVELEPGGTLELTDIELPLLKVKVTFVLKTRGASVKLQYEEDGKKKTESLTFKGDKAEAELDTSKSWTVIALARGYDRLEKKLTFEGSEEEYEVEVALQQEREASTKPGPEPTGKEPEEPKPAAGDGFINANSIPPSRVIINGRPYGSTPVTGVKVPPGSYTVIFKHPELGTQSRTVSVGAGQTRTATVRFKKSD